MQKRDPKYKFSLYSQLSKSSMHSCSSMGYFVRSMSHAAVDVILKWKPSWLHFEHGAGHREEINSLWSCVKIWKVNSDSFKIMMLLGFFFYTYFPILLASFVCFTQLSEICDWSMVAFIYLLSICNAGLSNGHYGRGPRSPWGLSKGKTFLSLH